MNFVSIQKEKGRRNFLRKAAAVGSLLYLLGFPISRIKAENLHEVIEVPIRLITVKYNHFSQANKHHFTVNLNPKSVTHTFKMERWQFVTWIEWLKKRQR